MQRGLNVLLKYVIKDVVTYTETLMACGRHANPVPMREIRETETTEIVVDVREIDPPLPWFV